MDLLKKQLDGKIPHYLPREVLETEYTQSLKSVCPQQIQSNVGAVAIWVVNQPDQYLLGLTRRGKTVRAVDLNSSDGRCYPTTVKVDHSQNVWVNCGGGPGSLTGFYQERNSLGTLTNSYAWQMPTLQCPPSAISCQDVAGYTQDGAQNGSDVFVSVTVVTQYCTYYGSQQQCNSVQSGGFLWWPLGNPSATPAFISLENCCGSAPIQDVGYMDLDGNGDILFDYQENSISGSCYGVGEITNPTNASWSFVSLIPCTSGSSPLSDPAGVYVGHSGSTSTLNVTSPGSRLVYRWVLPLTPSSTYTTLGPTHKNVEGKGAPVSGGFGPGDAHMVLGDGAGWVDSGNVANNKWTILLNKDLSGPDLSAALTPSDK